MNQKKPTLGRGLADLLGQARPVVASDGGSAGTGAPASRGDLDEELGDEEEADGGGYTQNSAVDRAAIVD